MTKQAVAQLGFCLGGVGLIHTHTYTHIYIYIYKYTLLAEGAFTARPFGQVSLPGIVSGRSKVWFVKYVCLPQPHHHCYHQKICFPFSIGICTF